MAKLPKDDDRAAILARRNHFISRALDGIDSLRGDANERTKRRTRAAVLTVSSLAIACPCLDVAPPDTGEEETPTDLPAESETGPATETGASETETSGGAQPNGPSESEPNDAP